MEIMIIQDWKTIGFECTLLDRVDNIIICEKRNRGFTFIDGKVYQSTNIKRITSAEKTVIKKQIDAIEENHSAKV